MSSLRAESKYRGPIGKAATMAKASIRRMIVKVTTKALWQVIGYDDEEDKDLPVFSGIGFYSRPPDSGTNPEVIVLKIGGKTAHAVIVGSRDEDVRLALTAIKNMAANEAAIHNTLARVHVTADGKVLVDDGSGAVELALKSDAKGIQDAIASAAVVAGDGGAAFKTNIATNLAGFPVGTTVLKGK